MPEISADGKTWTIRIRPGIYFADDPVFKGKRRELIAADYVYALEAHPRSEDALELAADGRRPLRRAPTRWSRRRRKPGTSTTMRRSRGCRRSTATRCGFKLVFADYELLSNLTTSATAAVAREVIEAHAEAAAGRWPIRSARAPIGSSDWRRGQRIMLEANPAIATSAYPAPTRCRATRRSRRARPGASCRSCGASRSASSRKRSRGSSRSSKGELDYVAVPADLVTKVLDATTGRTPELATRGRARSRAACSPPSPTCTSTWRIRSSAATSRRRSRCAARSRWATTSTRRSACCARGRAMPATQVVPPNMTGHDRSYDGRVKFDVAGAKALLDKFGYVDATATASRTARRQAADC